MEIERSKSWQFRDNAENPVKGAFLTDVMLIDEAGRRVEITAEAFHVDAFRRGVDESLIRLYQGGNAVEALTAIASEFGVPTVGIPDGFDEYVRSVQAALTSDDLVVTG